MMRKMTEVGKLKEGSFIIIDDEPCRIVSFSTSPPGAKSMRDVKRAVQKINKIFPRKSEKVRKSLKKSE